MKFEKQLFIQDVLGSVPEAQLQDRAAIDLNKATVAANKLAAEFNSVFAQVPEETAVGQVLARYLKDDGTIGYQRIAFSKAVHGVAEAVAVGAILAIFTGPATSILVAAGYAAAKKCVEWLVGKKGETLSKRDGALVGALIALQYDAKIVTKRDDVFPTVPEIQAQANLILTKSRLLQFDSQTEVAKSLEELRTTGIINEKDADRWDLVEAVWVL
jgi:hypothetical protein